MVPTSISIGWERRTHFLTDLTCCTCRKTHGQLQRKYNTRVSPHACRSTHAYGTIKFMPPWILPQFPAKINQASPTPECNEDKVMTLCSFKWLRSWGQKPGMGRGEAPTPGCSPLRCFLWVFLGGSGQAGYRAGGWSSGWSEARQIGGGGGGSGEN